MVSTIDSNHPTSDLEAHRASIVEDFKSRPPAPAKEAAAWIEKMTGISRSAQRVRIFMKKIGISFRKTAAIPAKSDAEKQDEFKKKSWNLK
ncbi:winged helix-turn-helix domain-containing protein [Desulfosarcina sp. OttesenSCG-928-A07]|nr:winged helix-turn-helix domain-containing protein [Desulfosarcina sp. OttesenSCG-928-G17]MDL2328456.1 winged helix-turn-helix domain-containing protein [Desulfosarcina sp. OttesenSCG-928-A07]